MRSLLRSVRIEIGSHSIKDRTEWRAWRAKAIEVTRCATASTMSAFFGHHYTSFRAAMLENFGSHAEDNHLAAAAKAHGENTEEEAKREFIQVSERPCAILCDGETSKIHLCMNVERLASAVIMTTPDMIVRFGNHKEVIEFKCPYFELRMPKMRKNRTVFQIANDYQLKNQHGKPSSFLQAAVYAYVEGDITRTRVCYYFTDDVEQAMLIYRYNLEDNYDEVERCILQSADKINTELGKEPGDIKYRTLTSDKLFIQRLMTACCVKAELYNLSDLGTWEHCVLYEKTPNGSEEKRPEEPREPGAWCGACC